MNEVKIQCCQDPWTLSFFPENNATALLGLAKSFQMQELTFRCESCLLEQRPSVDLLLKAQEYALPRLKDHCIKWYKQKDFHKIEHDRRFQSLSDDVMKDLVLERLKTLEDTTAVDPEQQRMLEVTVDELRHIFEDMKAVCKQRTGLDREDESAFFRRARVAVHTLKKKEFDTSQKPYSDACMKNDESTSPRGPVDESEANDQGGEEESEEDVVTESTSSPDEPVAGGALSTPMKIPEEMLEKGSGESAVYKGSRKLTKWTVWMCHDLCLLYGKLLTHILWKIGEIIGTLLI